MGYKERMNKMMDNFDSRMETISSGGSSQEDFGVAFDRLDFISDAFLGGTIQQVEMFKVALAKLHKMHINIDTYPDADGKMDDIDYGLDQAIDLMNKAGRILDNMAKELKPLSDPESHLYNDGSENSESNVELNESITKLKNDFKRLV